MIREGDAGALASRKGGIHGAGLVSALWTSTRESLTTAPVAQVHRAALGRGGNWVPRAYTRLQRVATVRTLNTIEKELN